MNKPTQVGQIFNTFVHLLAELEPFVETKDIRLSFDASGHAFLQGADFQVQLQANPTRLLTEVYAIFYHNALKLLMLKALSF